MARSEVEIAERRYEIAVNKMMKAMNSPHQEHFDIARQNAETLLGEIAEKKKEARNFPAPRSNVKKKRK